MSEISIPHLIQKMRENHTAILAEGQRKQDTLLRMSPEDAERVLTAALVKTFQEMVRDGYIVDDTNLPSRQVETRKTLQ